MSKQRPKRTQQKKTTRWPVFIWAAAGIVAVVALVVILSWPAADRVSLSDTTPEADFALGDVRYCLGAQPPFIQALGFTGGIALDTRAQHVRGVQLHEYDRAGNILNTWQHPSWGQAGYMGTYTMDRNGDIYIIPAPFVSLLDNPPERANILYRIDRETGEMAPMLDLPLLGDLPAEAVYGLTDLAYDCDTHQLYAASILGATRDQMAGRIFQIDLATQQVVSTIDGLDALSLSVFNSSKGKRLYIGAARSAEVYSVPLDATGRFIGALRQELSLESMGVHQDERARQLNFVGQQWLAITMMQFDYNLVATTELQQTRYEYEYLPENDTWRLDGSYLLDG